jgi:DNA-binding SARP family transcriptional activator
MLGSFEVRTDDGVLADVPGARLRGLLIALALEPGLAVPKATLVDWIWGERPPSGAANALQRLVSRLRKALPEGLVEGQTDGYRLRVEPDAVDAVRFERLVGQARNDEDPRRVRLLREALALWRGAAMQDVGLQDSAAFDAAVTRLEGLRLTAMEDRFDAEISLGHGVELVTELTDLVTAHPVRERLVAALMRALVATGRDTEALLVYQRTREALADALGVDPSPELSALHVALLRGELGRREEDRKTNLRAELTSFVGKDADVAAVRELIAEHRLTTLTGPGGVEFEDVGEPEPDVAAGDLALEGVGSALCNQVALVEHRDPVGELIGFFEILGSEENGHAVGHQLADDVPHGATAARIQSRRRLVQENDLWPGDQRHRQVQLPAHTAGIGRRHLLRRLRQIEPFQQRGDHPLALVSPQMVQIRHQLQVLFSRQQLIHRRELTGDPDYRAHLLGLGRNIMPGNPYRPTVGLHQRGQHVHRRRLTRPIRAEQGKDRARTNV